MEKIEIYDVLSVAIGFINDPENPEREKDLEDLKEQLVIMDYIPLRKKEILLKKVFADISTQNDLPYEYSTMVEVMLLFDVLLAYVVNIDPDINTVFKDVDYYDALCMSGLYEYILDFCEDDYNKIVKMVDRMISFDNIQHTVEVMEQITPESVDKLTEEFKQFETNLNPELLEAYGKVLAALDPTATQMRQGLEDSAYNALNTILAAGEEDEEEDSSLETEVDSDENKLS